MSYETLNPIPRTFIDKLRGEPNARKYSIKFTPRKQETADLDYPIRLQFCLPITHSKTTWKLVSTDKYKVISEKHYSMEDCAFWEQFTIEALTQDLNWKIEFELIEN